MHRDLTVREAIRHSARCRLPASWTSKEIDKHVDAVLKVLRYVTFQQETFPVILFSVEHVADSLIGDEMTRGISGGQRKRANVGMELASIPLAIFLDEPTTGLDSTSALDLSQVLHSIARLGLTIVAVIHQPRIEIFNQFDDILMLVPGGQTAYFGSLQNALSYFKCLGYDFQPGVNPADIYMDILSGRIQRSTGPPLSGDELVRAFQKSKRLYSVPISYTPQSNYTIEMKRIVGHRGAQFLPQFWYCSIRSFIQQSRALTSLAIETFCALFAGIIMGVAIAEMNEPFTGMLVDPYSVMSKAPTVWFPGMCTLRAYCPAVPNVIDIFLSIIDGMLIGMSISLAGAPAGVNVFTEEKVVFWRERASGHNAFAYFIVSLIYNDMCTNGRFSYIHHFILHFFCLSCRILMSFPRTLISLPK